MSDTRAAERFVLLDLGGVMVSLHAHEAYERLGRPAGVPGDVVRQRLRESGLVLAFETGASTTDQFVAAARMATGLTAVSAADFLAGFTAIVGRLDPLLVPPVRALAGQGRLAFVSNTNPPHWTVIEEQLTPIGIRAPAILSYEVGFAKPDQRFFTAIPPAWRERGVYLDDLPDNVAAGRRVGITSHLHHTAAETTALLNDILADRTPVAEPSRP